MSGKFARIVLVAALLVGLITMHSFGHSSHGGAQHGQMAEMVQTSSQIQMQHIEEPPVEEETDPSSLLSTFVLIVCSAIVARAIVIFFRSPTWSRLRDWITTPNAQVESEFARHWIPPPRLEATGVLLNRIAVLRI